MTILMSESVNPDRPEDGDLFATARLQLISSKHV